MKVLVACEYSGIVREAFKARGHDAWSCDLLDTEIPGNHIKGDVREILDGAWDLMIAHPPCPYLCCSANRVFLNNPDRWGKRLKAIKFVWELLNAPIPKIALENPKGVISTHIRKPDQIINPYYFGDSVQKETHLWLKDLPKLEHYNQDTFFKSKTHVDPGEFYISPTGKRMHMFHAKSASTNNPENAKLRSKTFLGIAKAMAEQWG